mmetsp:Transcript_31107/g.65647  ORF Transcript_31107/g.65647 Transcript_31107/m.65647 type:complete len:225 (-) Transcript_31107:920-1594(-)
MNLHSTNILSTPSRLYPFCMLPRKDNVACLRHPSRSPRTRVTPSIGTLAYNDTPTHAHSGNIRKSFIRDHSHQCTANTHGPVQLSYRRRLVFYIHGMTIINGIVILIEEEKGFLILNGRFSAPPPSSGGRLFPPEVMDVVRVWERIAVGYGKEYHFKRNEEILKSINDMLRIPIAYFPNYTKRVKYFNEEALPKCKKDNPFNAQEFPHRIPFLQIFLCCIVKLD